MESRAHTLSARQGAALVISSMIGSGIFTTSGLLIEILGSASAVLAVWLAAGALALCGAAAYAELGVLMPRAGGEYVFLSQIYHPLVGYLSGVVSLAAGFSAPIAAAALAFSRYAAPMFPGVSPVLVASLLIGSATTVNIAAPHVSTRVQSLLAISVVALGVVITAVLICGTNPMPAVTTGPPVNRSPGHWGLALVLTSYSYMGWNAAAYVAGELKQPRRDVPRALVGGTLTVTILYLGFNAALLLTGDPDGLRGRIDVAHAAVLGRAGTAAAGWVSIAIGVALMGHVLAMITTGARVYAAMAEDGLFPAALGRRSTRGAPTFSIGLQGAMALLLCWTASFESLLVYTGLLLGLSTLLTVAGVFVWRRRRPQLYRPYRAVGHPLSTGLFVLFGAGSAVHAVRERPIESLAGLSTLVIGTGLYAVSSYRRRRARIHTADNNSAKNGNA